MLYFVISAGRLTLGYEPGIQQHAGDVLYFILRNRNAYGGSFFGVRQRITWVILPIPFLLSNKVLQQRIHVLVTMDGCVVLSPCNMLVIAPMSY